ncbi:MAG: Trm112 family protein [Actinomycetota bacterium]
MALDTRLLAVLACPVDKGPLYYLGDDAGLYNPRLRRRYVVREGIPVMLPDEAETVSAEEAAGLDARIASGELTPTFAARG